MTDPAKYAERLSEIARCLENKAVPCRYTPDGSKKWEWTSEHVQFLYDQVVNLTKGRDTLRKSLDDMMVVNAAMAQERDEARRSAEALEMSNVRRLANVIAECPVCSGDCRCPIANQQAIQPAPNGMIPLERLDSANAGGHSDPKTNASATSADDMERARESKEAAHQRYYSAFHDWFSSDESNCDFWSECDAPEALATIAVEIHDAALTTARREGAELRALDEAVVEAARAAYDTELRLHVKVLKVARDLRDALAARDAATRTKE